MRKIVIVIVIAGLPSLVTARPTLSIYLDDNEPGVGIRPRQAIDFCAAGVYGWLGRLDLLQITRTHTPPLYPHLLSKLDPGVPWTIPPGAGRDPTSPSFAWGFELPIPTLHDGQGRPHAIDRWEGPTPVPDPGVPYRPLDAARDRHMPRLIVLELVGERQPIEPTLSIKMTTFPRYP